MNKVNRSAWCTQVNYEYTFESVFFLQSFRKMLEYIAHCVKGNVK